MRGLGTEVPSPCEPPADGGGKVRGYDKSHTPANRHKSMNWTRHASWLGAALIALGSLAPSSDVCSAGEPAAQPPNTDRHLVGWWTFDGDGKTAADSSKGGHAGTFEGGAVFEAGRIGQAVALDGKDACIRIAGFKGVTSSGPRTVAAWIKTAKAGGDIVAWGADDHGKLWKFGFVRGRVGVSPKGGYLYMRAALNDDAWHHVAVVVLEASVPNLHDHVKLYADGEPAEIHDIGLLDLWPIETGDKLDVTIGRGLKGLMDDVRIYDRALSEDEIKALFQAGGKPPPTKP